MKNLPGFFKNPMIFFDIKIMNKEKHFEVSENKLQLMNLMNT